jgi:hypothetical protein
MFTQNDINALIAILGVGRQNAQIAAVIAGQLNYPVDGNQVRTRQLIKYSIQHGHLIKSSTRNPAGFWLSSDKREIVNNINSLRRRAQRTNNSANNLQAEWNRQNPNDLI